MLCGKHRRFRLRALALLHLRRDLFDPQIVAVLPDGEAGIIENNEMEARLRSVSFYTIPNCWTRAMHRQLISERQAIGGKGRVLGGCSS